MSRSLLVAALVMLVSLAGCSGSGDGDTPGASQLPDDGNRTALAASILVQIEGNDTLPTNGSIATQVGVNVTFDGSASTGSNLSYAWAFGDGNETTGSTAVYTYASAGVYNVTLTVASGNASAMAFVLLNVTTAGPPAGTIIWTDVKSFDGTLLVGNPNSNNAEGTDHRFHAVPIVDKDPNGTAVLAKKIVIVLDGSGAGVVDMYVYWRKGSTNLASQSTPQGPGKTLTYEADMLAATDYSIMVRFAAGANASYTVKATISYAAV